MKKISILLFFLALLPLSAIAEIPLQGGITGSWYNPERDGEGFFVEIVNVNNNLSFVVSWYTYNQGGQAWLSGSAPFSRGDDRVTVPVFATSGTGFGDDFNTANIVRTTWGTLEFKFTSCTTGSVTYNSSIGFGSGSIQLLRLTNIEGLSCDGSVPPLPALAPPPTS